MRLAPPRTVRLAQPAGRSQPITEAATVVSSRKPQYLLRAGFVRVDTPAGLRSALGRQGLAIRLASSPSPDAVAALRELGGIGGVDARDGTLRIDAADPESVAPAVVRTLVAAGGEIVEVRVERPSLEQIYFDVMGVRPGADGVEAGDGAQATE